MGSPKINFTPGPSQLYFTVEGHMKKAFREGIPSISHRTKQFEKIFQSVDHGLRQLLGIPNGFHIFFCSSATEIWERSIQNLVGQQSYHLVNGAFSKKFHETSRQLGKIAEKAQVENGRGFHQVQVPANTELIAVTHNETSTGVSLPLEFIYSMKDQNPNSLLIVDAVSSLPFVNFDYKKIDSVFFSVQKGFGLPAGLGVWIVNEDCIAKADSLRKAGKLNETYHSIPSLHSFAKKSQTPETPNVLSIYLLGKVIEDQLARGMDVIRKETQYKAAILYKALEDNSLISPLVEEEQFRSPTVIVAKSDEHTPIVTDLLRSRGLEPGAGYGSNQVDQLRFANFPTHSKEQFELLVDTLNEI